MKPTLNSLITEVICSFFLGVIPTVFWYHTNGNQGAFTYVGEIIGGSYLIFVLYLVILLISLFLQNKQKSLIVKLGYNWAYILCEIFSRLGMTLISLFRAFSGALVTLLVISIMSKFSFNDVLTIWFVSLYAVCCLLFNTFLHSTQSDRFPSENPIQDMA